MKTKEFKEKLPSFREALQKELSKREPNTQVVVKEGSLSNIFKVTIMAGYYQEDYLIWTGSKGPQWCYDRATVNHGWR